MKIRVSLARLVRETRTVIVEAPDEQTAETWAHELFELVSDLDEGEGDWSPDWDWGYDEGSHSAWEAEHEDAEPEFRILPGGQIEEI